MNEQQLLDQINELKIRVKEIVLEIQGLKGQLEQSSITLDEFKSQKSILEDELRGILEQIADIKEKTGFKLQPRAKVEPIHVKTEPTLEKVGVPEPTLIKVEIPEPVIEKIETAELIDREIQIAGEAKDLMYYFQTEFIDSISQVLVYLSITLDDHFVIGIDFNDYPERPKLKVPPEVLELFSNSEKGFYSDISTYTNWDSEQPSRIYELATEIETVLINVFSADIDSLLKKSVEYVDVAKDKLKKLIKDVKIAAINKNYEKAIEICYVIIDTAYEVQDYDTAKVYTSKLNEFIKKSRSV